MSLDALYESLVAGLDPEALVGELQRLIAIRSENPFREPPRDGYREQELGAYYMGRLAALGLEVESREVVPGRPNVWGRLAGSGNGPALMLAGHLDTVGTETYPDPFDPKVADGRVYGRGSCDMKAALAAYLEVARLLVEGELRLSGDLIICGIADEEWQLMGSRDIGAKGPRADFGIIGEPTDLTICPAHKGEFAVAIRTFGTAVHASVPERGHNAIEDMGAVVAAFADYDQSLRQREAHALCGHGRFSIGVIRGGTLVATVPDFCELEVDRRLLPGETGEAVRAEYRARLERLAAERSGFRYELSEPLIDLPALDLPADAPVLRATVSAYEAVTGEAARVEAFMAGTDAPNLGFPALIFGPGSLAQAHSLCEYVEIEQLLTATKTYLRVTLELLWNDSS